MSSEKKRKIKSHEGERKMEGGENGNYGSEVLCNLPIQSLNF